MRSECSAVLYACVCRQVCPFPWLPERQAQSRHHFKPPSHREREREERGGESGLVKEKETEGKRAIECEGACPVVTVYCLKDWK